MKRQIKRLMSFIIAAALCIYCLQIGLIDAQAAVSGIYTYTVSNGTATITACDDEDATGVITIPQTLGGYPVTAIGANAFQQCDGITDIIIGDNILTIDEYAFYWCGSLKTVVIGNSVQDINTSTFLYCKVLVSVTFGSSIKTIGSDAFSNCNKLNNLVFPDSLISIGSYAFNRCSSLSSVTFGTGLTTISNYAFYYCSALTDITIPRNVTSIGNNAFSQCAGVIIHCYKDSAAHVFAVNNNISFQLIISLVNIVVTSMPSKLIYVIGDEIDITGLVITANYDDGSSTAVTGYEVSGFSSAVAGQVTVTVTYCQKTVTFTVNVIEFSYSLIGNSTQVEINGYKGAGGSVTIPAQIGGLNVTSIGDNTFLNCSSVTGITIPSTVTKIGGNAFKNCTGLTQISISQYITSIASTAFIGCSSLTQIDVNDSNSEYSDINGVLFNKNATQLLCYPAAMSGTDYTVPLSVTSVNSYAFYGCSTLTSLTVSYTVTNMAANSVSNCGLTINCYQYSKAHDYAVANGISFSFSATVSGITVTSLPSKVTYLVGESLITSGLVVCSNYTDGLSIAITNYSVSTLDSSRVGAETITVSFGGFTDTFDVNVVEPEETVYSYVLVNGGTQAQITGYTGSGGDLIIPTTINSYNVTQIGSHAFEHCTNISSIQLTDQITYIGDSAFAYCNNITSLNIPDSVITIGNNAFYSCTGVSQITGMQSVTSIGDWAFYYCTSLRGISLPDSVLSIGTYAFYNCSALESISLGSGISSIGDSVFWGCTKLTDISVDELNTAFSDDNDVLFNKGKTTLIYYPIGKADTSYTIGSTVRNISSGAFYSLTKLNSLTIPKWVSTIYQDAIKNCTNLTVYCYSNSRAHTYAVSNSIPFSLLASAALVSINISSLPVKTEYVINESLDLTGLTVVASYSDNTSETITGYSVGQFNSSTVGTKTVVLTFGSCTASFDVTVVNAQITPVFTYTLVENNTLAEITGYTGGGGDVVIPSIINGYEVVSIADDAFFRNSNITAVVVSYGIEEIGDSAFLGCTALTSVTISGSVITIGPDAFFQCSKLEKVVFGNGVQDIGTYSFSECTSLKRLTFPESVTSIGSSAFAGCTSLTNINLPDTITTIEAYTFQNCPMLTTALIGSNISSIGYYAFRNCTNLIIYCYENTSIYNYAVSNNISYVLVNNCGDYIIASISGGTNAQLVRYKGNSISLTVPAQIDGYTITQITAYAFSNCSNLVSVTIQEGVTYIGAGAFSDCSSLTAVTMPNSVATYNGAHVFDGIDDLTVYCNKNTATHQYAQDYGIFYILLDVRNLVGITVSVLPNKTEYLIGDELDLTGMVIAANYSNETYEYVTNYTVSGFSSQVVGEKVITVTYSGYQTTFSVYVSALTFNYDFVTESTITITGYNGSDTNVIIPQVFGGYTVVGIDDNAFEGNTSIQSVTIPDTVTSIGNDAFYGCTHLSGVTFGSGVVSLGTWVFYGCTSLTDIVLPDSVETIGGYTFYQCTSLNTVSIGESVKSIGYSAFRDCTKITAITVSTANVNYVSVNGVLYNAAKTELICYTSGVTTTSYTIPYTVTTIVSYSFNGCQYLLTLRISKTVATISANAFYNCVNMCVYCYNGSAAHTYATKNSLTYVLSDNNTLSLISGASTLVINSGYLSGIDYNNKTVESITSKFNNVNVSVVDKNNQTLSSGSIVGTGCKLRLLNSSNQVLQEVTIVIYGDIDGDGYYNGCDALLARLFAAGLLTSSSIGSAGVAAADVNDDGLINESDALIMENAGMFLVTISQT